MIFPGLAHKNLSCNPTFSPLVYQLATNVNTQNDLGCHLLKLAEE